MLHSPGEPGGFIPPTWNEANAEGGRLNSYKPGHPDWTAGVRPTGAGRPAGEGVMSGGPGSTSTNPVSVAWRKTELMRLLLEGHSAKEAAQVLEIHYVTALKYTRDAEWRRQAVQLSRELVGKLDVEFLQSTRSKTEIIDEMGFEALREMQAMLAAPSTHPAIKLKVAQDILDRDPTVSRTKKVDVTSRSFSIKGEDLLAAAMAARELEEKDAGGGGSGGSVVATREVESEEIE